MSKETTKNGQEWQNKLFIEYMKELEKPEYDVLAKEEEFRLMKDYLDSGNEESKEQIIKHNLRLVPYVVKQYNIYTSDPMDLIQAGNIGLLEAFKNFNPDEGVRFGTYAIFIVRKHVLNVATTDANKVYIPYAMNAYVEKYKKIMEQASKKEIELTDEEIMAEMKIKPATLKTVRMAVSIEYLSMDIPIGSDACGKTYVSDIVQDENIEDFTSNVEREEMHEFLVEALEGLKPREYDIVVHSFGWNGYQKQSSKELANKYGITMERICQVRKQACEKMRLKFKKQGIVSVDF